MKAKKVQRKKLWVAVVAREPLDQPLHLSLRDNGTYQCFMGNDRLKVVARALDARSRWGMHYRILVGNLQQEVKPAQEFSFVALNG